MSKTIKELAEEFGVSKTAIRNKLTEEFRSKWVRTSTANGVQTLVITEDGIKALKSMFKDGNQGENLGANQSQISYVSKEFYESQIEKLQKLLDQSQQLLLNEQKKTQMMLESKVEPADWEEEKTRLEKQVSSYQSSLLEANRISREHRAKAENAERLFMMTGVMASIFFVTIILFVLMRFF